MKSVLLSLSGGVDSSTMLAWFMESGFSAQCVSFYYGSKHNAFENKAAVAVADHYQVPLDFIDLSGFMSTFQSNLLLSGGAVPEGHYEQENMKETVVPARNAIFLSVLAGLAESRGIEAIAFGAHQGDHAIYPDCRVEFHKAMDCSLYLATGGKVGVLAPFLNWDKTGIVKWGLSHNVPYNLTRTCYKAQETACGKCGACVERLESFAQCGGIDPISYQER